MKYYKWSYKHSTVYISYGKNPDETYKLNMLVVNDDTGETEVFDYNKGEEPKPVSTFSKLSTYLNIDPIQWLQWQDLRQTEITEQEYMNAHGIL